MSHYRLRHLILSASLIGLCACTQAVNTKSPAPTGQEVHKAKNIILFIGDGMGISTITAARIFAGQSEGGNGENYKLSFEKFPQTALVRTYNLDAQVPDSAGTASAINTGKRTQIGKINVQPDGPFAGCAKSTDTPPPLFADLAENAGLSTGVVSTARLTHATPAAVYGHALSRGWESDGDVRTGGKEQGCVDLATQLIQYGGQNGLEIALGGGRRAFLPRGHGGKRQDGKNLTIGWTKKSNDHVYVEDASGLRALKPEAKQAVLGLFQSSHMSYEVDRDNAKEPSLTELTQFAIQNLEARGTGYFLMVEAGRIDHAHHATNAYRALSETQELSNAVALADKLTNDDDTLILVTADHSHVFTMAGYPKLGNPILGLVHPPRDDESGHGPSLDANGLPYTTLGYQNGPNVRNDKALTEDQVTDKNYRQQAAIPRPSETHGGEDVALFAKGPGAENVHGVIDQYEIFNIMKTATDMKP